MLFNSYIFIFAFLPLAVAGFFALAHWLPRGVRRRAAIGWLVLASLAFYAWWNPPYVLLLLFSLAFNFAAGWAVARRHGDRRSGRSLRRLALVLGIGVNLGLLGFFKYADFFIATMNAAIGADFNFLNVILPLAISFFTFQQITYLVDSYRGDTVGYSFLDYALFVTFFPQLIAGPIVHHKEMMPQFRDERTFRFDPLNVSVGLTLFTTGLFKKVVIADSLAPYANQVFTAAENGVSPGFAEAWTAALVYALQLYFDFSGYSDMALGVARMFGVRLPVNFDSPYKARNTGEFWRRWHVTLGRFLRDYVYIPMGGSRRGTLRRFANIYVVMILCGFWHGAGWTFIVFGAVHATFVAANHVLLMMKRHRGAPDDHGGRTAAAFAWCLTMGAFLLSIVLFRAESFGSALLLLREMILPSAEPTASPIGLDVAAGLTLALPLLVFCLLAPNSNAIMADYHRPIAWRPREEGGHEPAAPKWLRWRPTLPLAVITAAMFVVSVLLLSRANEFLYFQF